MSKIQNFDILFQKITFWNWFEVWFLNSIENNFWYFSKKLKCKIMFNCHCTSRPFLSKKVENPRRVGHYSLELGSVLNELTMIIIVFILMIKRCLKVKRKNKILIQSYKCHWARSDFFISKINKVQVMPFSRLFESL